MCGCGKTLLDRSNHGKLRKYITGIRNSARYADWHKKVLQKNNYTCQKTGVKGGKLIPHHILNFAEYPELRLNVSNGITLSKKSHEQFHKIYGKRNNNKEQLEEFLQRSI